MKLKYNLAASVAAFILSQNVVAQQRFNEMSYSPSETTFRLNAPSKPTLRLYEAGRGGKAYKKVKLAPSGDNTWTATVKGDLKGSSIPSISDTAKHRVSLPKRSAVMAVVVPLLT